MYFWKIKLLVEELKTGKVEQKQRLHYLLAWVVFGTLFVYLGIGMGEKLSQYLVIEMVGAVTICVFGTLICFSTNSRGDNKEFIDRYICLGIPVGIRTFAIVIPMYIVTIIIGYIILGKGFFNPINNNRGLSELIFSLLSDVLFYYMLNNNIKKVTQKDTQSGKGR